jgi:hypothetical protein
LARRVAVLAAAGALSACAVADRFSSRELAYDTQAEQVRDTAVVLNVLRAAERKPMLFVDVGQVTGTSTVSGTGALSIPLWIMNAVSPGTGMASPSVSVSGGPTFALTPLVSKEFYQGIMSPVPTALLADLVQTGLPKQLLFLLAIQRMTITYANHGTFRSLTLSNDFFRDDAARFASQLDRLVAAGFTIENTTTTTPVGPPLSKHDVMANPALWPPLSGGARLVHHDADAARHAPEHWQIETTATDATFCFHPGDPAAAGGQAVPLPDDFAPGIDPPLLASFFCPGVEHVLPQPVTRPKTTRTGYDTKMAGTAQPYTIDVVTRSVEQMFYYLGELTRARLALSRDVTLPPPGPGLDQSSLFQIHEGRPPAGADALTARYDGHAYWVRADPTGQDRTTQVMELLMQLTALNDSAKDLPAPSAITLIPH